MTKPKLRAVKRNQPQSTRVEESVNAPFGLPLLIFHDPHMPHAFVQIQRDQHLLSQRPSIYRSRHTLHNHSVQIHLVLLRQWFERFERCGSCKRELPWSFDLRNVYGGH